MTEDDEDEMYGLRCGMGSLEAENARLRERLVHMELHECPGCRNVADLQEALDENAKLRELVDYMTPIALYGASEQERTCMRKLGLKVDE